MVNILLIDDDKYICDIVKILLKAQGFNVDVANTGEECLQKWNKKIYDFAFIDIRLPDISGIELLTQLKGINPDAVKIMITGYSNDNNKVEALKKGAVAIVEKPFKPEEIIEIVKANLESRKAKR